MHQRAAQNAAARVESGPDPRYHLRRLGDLMHTSATLGRRWVSLFAAALFVFQALIASSALAGPRVGSGGVTTIICTASGPRVVTLGLESIEGTERLNSLKSLNSVDSATQGAAQHSGAMPHCCVAGCAMLGGATLPGLWRLAWTLPAIAQPSAAPAAAVPRFCSAHARLQQRPRAPPPAG